MDIEGEIIKKVGKILFVTFFIAMMAGTVFFVGLKVWYWQQVDHEVVLQMEKLHNTSYGDIVSRAEVRYVQVWWWTATIDIQVVKLSDSEKTVFVNVNASADDASAHSYHTQVKTADGVNGAWSAWVKNSDYAK